MIQAMQQDSSVIALGCGMHSPLGIFGTVSGLLDKFGPERAIETPVSENGITGIAIGAAITGLRPVLVHQRIDFILLSLDQIVNHAAKLRYISAGKLSVPLTIRCIIGFGWGQGAQHSQSFHAALSNIPGLRVVMPSNGADAKACSHQVYMTIIPLFSLSTSVYTAAYARLTVDGIKSRLEKLG